MPAKRHDAEGDERAEHQEVAMRKVDDAHDAEHEIETDADQAEIQAEQNAGDERVDQHQRARSRHPVSDPRPHHGRG